MFQPLYSYEEQLHQLAQLVDEVHIRKHPRVKGPYTTSDYVTWRLNNILTPTGWSFELLTGPDLVHIDDQKAYIRCTGRLSITLANGQSAFRDDVGVWPLYAAKIGEGGLLDQTAPELYETAIKAAVSDCLKACAERLGATFRPLLDIDFGAWLRYQQSEAIRAAKPKLQMDANQAIAELFDGVDIAPKASDPSPKKSTPSPPKAQPEKDQHEYKTEFYALAGPAIASGKVTGAEVNALSKGANGDGWDTVLVELKKRIGD